MIDGSEKRNRQLSICMFRIRMFVKSAVIRTVLPLDEKKNWHKSMFSFLAVLLNCVD